MKNKTSFYLIFIIKIDFSHSHFEMQVADGLAGVMIVKDCNDIDRFKNSWKAINLYSEEEDWDNNVVAFHDWFHAGKDPDGNLIPATAEENFINYAFTD